MNRFLCSLIFLVCSSTAFADTVDSLKWDTSQKQVQVITHSSGTKKLNTAGGASPSSVLPISASYTITDTDGVKTILVTTASSTITITLPSAATNKGREITIKKVDSGTGKITVNRAGSDTIDGATTFDLGAGAANQYSRTSLTSDSSIWQITSSGMELLEGSTTTDTNVAASNAYYDVATVTLTAGDWDVSGTIYTDRAGATLSGSFDLGIWAASGNSSVGLKKAQNYYNFNGDFVLTNTTITASTGIVRVQSDGTNLTFAGTTASGTQVIRLKSSVAYSAGQPTYQGYIRARRVR